MADMQGPTIPPECRYAMQRGPFKLDRICNLPKSVAQHIVRQLAAHDETTVADVMWFLNSMDWKEAYIFLLPYGYVLRGDCLSTYELYITRGIAEIISEVLHDNGYSWHELSTMNYYTLIERYASLTTLLDRLPSYNDLPPVYAP